MENGRLRDTLLELHHGGRSGVLRIEKGPQKRQLALRGGLLVFAESNLPEEHLVRVLVRLDLLPRAKVKEAAALMKGGKTSEEAALALNGSNEQHLEKGRMEQALCILAAAWGWNECDIRFFPGEGLIRSRVDLRLSLPDSIALSVRRAVSVRLFHAPPDFARRIFRRSRDSEAKIPIFPLDAAESLACSLLQEPAGGAAVLARLPSTETGPSDILLRLCLLGLIEAEEPARSGGTPDTDSSAGSLDALLQRFAAASLYEILSISPDAGPEEIQTAYHGLARQYHPDHFQSREHSPESRERAEQVFTCINRAYVTLKDPAARAEYDQTRLLQESKVEAELKARAAAPSDDARTARALFNDGRALLEQGEIEKAIERLKGCVWLNPEEAAYHHYLGMAEAEVPRLRKSAEQHFLKALELKSTATASRLELAKLYVNSGLVRKAEAQLRELLEWDPEHREAQRLLSELNP